MYRIIRSILAAPKCNLIVDIAVRKSSSRPLFKPVTHCLFDMDGLLLDTEYIYEDSVREICRSFGKDYPWDVRMKVMGTQAARSAQIVIEDVALPISVAEFLKIQGDYVRTKFTEIDLMKGAERLIRHLHETQVPFCLATSSGQEMAALEMSNYPELFDLFLHKVMGSTDREVKHGKPAPDIFLVAASRFKDKPHPSKCLVFEDSPNGVRAGISAGMQAVMVVPDPKLVTPEQQNEATIVLESLEQFKPELFGLPKFKD
ncbi:probable pseudouridine-5'-phosphatase [Sitodiplosis mosellana]|uniref:probable pseudouridine-5'-phosphatase n=1 Tax=Sitodiplosis mosellana TaxID=263140 RepID=UPI0024444180|nr:probable pseudouridine-5'-phosphatase [Sitodiplosis mosellana]